MTATVGELRELMLDLSDDTPLVVPDESYSAFYSGSASIKVLQYHEISETFTTGEVEGSTIPSVPRRCLVIG
jgi:hypothetical protein